MKTLTPEIMARNYISRNYLKKDMPDLISGLKYDYGINYSADQISRVATKITQGMCMRAAMVRNTELRTYKTALI